MRYMKGFGIFQINEAKYKLSDDLRNFISDIDMSISKQILSADKEVKDGELLDIDHQSGEIVVKKDKHKSKIKIGRAVNDILGNGNYSQIELDNFSKMVNRKILPDISVLIPAEYSEDFPANFSGALIRGVKMNKRKIFVDEPGIRNVSVGDSNEKRYLKFIEILSNTLSERIDKSVHMLMSRDSEDINTVSHFGNLYHCIPKKGASFSYCEEFRNGGVGNLWFFANRIVKENMQHIELLKKYLETSSEEDAIDAISDMIREIDEMELKRKVVAYVNWLNEIGVVGDMTYEDMVEKCKTKTFSTLHVWTESNVLHILV